MLYDGIWGTCLGAFRMGTFNRVYGNGSLQGQPVERPFTPGMRIATARGEVAIGTLRVGDRIITRDNGLQEIRWIGCRIVNTAEMIRNKCLRPIRFCKGSLGNDLPERDMIMSPNHRMLVASDKTALHFDQSEALVAAKHLTGLKGVSAVAPMDACYIYLMFDQHELILSNGLWSESFQPAMHSVAGVGNAQRLELLMLFPELGAKRDNAATLTH